MSQCDIKSPEYRDTMVSCNVPRDEVIYDTPGGAGVTRPRPDRLRPNLMTGTWWVKVI